MHPAKDNKLYGIHARAGTRSTALTYPLSHSTINTSLSPVRMKNLYHSRQGSLSASDALIRHK